MPPARVRPPLPRILALGCIWGTSFLLIKVGLEGLSPTQVVLGRLVGGAAVLAAALAFAGLRPPREPVVWAHLALMGLVANVVPFFLFAWGEQRVSTGLAAIFNATTPLLTLAIAGLALPGERPGRTRLAGLGLGFVGVLVVVSPWSGLPAGAVSGDLACLGAATCYGLSFVWTRRFLSPRGYPPLVLAAGQLGCAAVLLAVLAPLVAAGPAHLSARVLAAVAVLGALGTGLAYLLSYGLIRDVGATGAATVTYVIPVVAVALGAAFLGERIGPGDLVGAVVVIAGVALAEGRLSRVRWLPRAAGRGRPGAG